MSHAARTALILFARAPQPGRVKTRLAASVGEVEAARLYAVLLGRSLRLLANWPGPRVLACADAASRDYFCDQPLALGAERRLQAGPDLGARMATALDDALQAAPQALLMGSDLLDVEQDDLRCAANWLAGGVDAVLGPVADGGYWLIGLRRPQPGLFADMRWSTPAVLQDTRARALASGLSWRELPCRRDLDEAADMIGFEDLLAAEAPLPLVLPAATQP